MKGISVLSNLVLALLLGAAQCFAVSNTILSIRCAEADRATKIYLNGQYKGDCTENLRLDLFLEPGEYQLKAVKVVDSDHEQTSEQTVTTAVNRPNRLNLSLSAPRVTAVAEERAARKDLQAAQGGNVSAMKSLAQRYKTGKGVPQDSAQAQKWQKKAEEATAIATAKADLRAAQNGDLVAMAAMVRHYERGEGVQKSDAEANVWRHKLAQAEEEAAQRQRAFESQLQAQKDRERVEAEQGRVQEQRAAKREDLQRELSNNEFLKVTKKTADKVFSKGHIESKMKEMGPFFFTIYPSIPVMVTVQGAFELIITEPTRTLERQRIQKELDTLASAWAKPDSLLARVYEQQKMNRAGQGALVVATR